MNDLERKQLSQLIRDNDVEDVTEAIRTRKHGPRLKSEIASLYDLVEKAHVESRDIDDYEPERACFFMFSNYTDIFNKVKKDIIDRKMLNLFVDKLIMIEKGECDQHEAAVEVGKLLKKMYIDSALKNAKNLEDNESKETSKPLSITYAEFKNRLTN
tara:strand:+ start:356 stop:826 length:471 start_codon:yes stop_codon:yes gene_type:complete